MTWNKQNCVTLSQEPSWQATKYILPSLRVHRRNSDPSTAETRSGLEFNPGNGFQATSNPFDEKFDVLEFKSVGRQAPHSPRSTMTVAGPAAVEVRGVGQGGAEATQRVGGPEQAVNVSRSTLNHTPIFPASSCPQLVESRKARF